MGRDPQSFHGVIVINSALLVNKGDAGWEHAFAHLVSLHSSAPAALGLFFIDSCLYLILWVLRWSRWNAWKSTRQRATLSFSGTTRVSFFRLSLGYAKLSFPFRAKQEKASANLSYRSHALATALRFSSSSRLHILVCVQIFASRVPALRRPRCGAAANCCCGPCCKLPPHCRAIPRCRTEIKDHFVVTRSSHSAPSRTCPRPAGPGPPPAVCCACDVFQAPTPACKERLSYLEQLVSEKAAKKLERTDDWRAHVPPESRTMIRAVLQVPPRRAPPDTPPPATL